jgi:hypothetical protein
MLFFTYTLKLLSVVPAATTMGGLSKVDTEPPLATCLTLLYRGGPAGIGGFLYSKKKSSPIS